MKNILILGLGAIGSAAAKHFQDYKHDYDVRMMCDNDRYDRYSKDGFIINGKRYDFAYTTPSRYKQKADLIIVVTKYTHLKDAIKLLDEAVGENTAIISLLNGIDSEEIIGSRFGMDKMVNGYVTRTDATKFGNVNNYSSDLLITFGDIANAHQERIDDIAKVFADVKIDYHISHNILKRQWGKFTTNIGLNQVSAVIKACYGDFTKSPHILSLLSSAMNEIIAIGQKKGIEMDTAILDKVVNTFPKLSKDGKTSMLQDVLSKRITEVDMLSGKVIEMGKELGIPTPVNQFLYWSIKGIEALY